MTPRTPEHVTAMIERYAKAATDSDVDGVVSCFAEHAELRDPYDGPAITGRDAIREFFAVGVTMIESLAVNGPIRITGDAASAAAPMLAHIDMQGTKLVMDTIDVFFFDEDGRFAAMHGFYGPTNVRPQG
jgi:ketosteroid isomerase-like protein